MSCHITSQRKQTLLYLLGVYISFIFMISSAVWADDKPQQQMAIFHTATGKHKIRLEVARTPQDMKQGLMFRKTLAPDAGMVFIYPRPEYAGIWMKNTYIPLDIIFIDCAGRILNIDTRQPLTTSISYSEKKACTTIEVNAGLAKQWQLTSGDLVRYVPRLN